MEGIKKDIQYLENKLISTKDELLKRAIEIKLSILKNNKVVTKWYTVKS